MKVLHFRKALILSLVLVILILAQACKKDEEPEPEPPTPTTTLNLEIIKHPEGGDMISQVSAEFEGKILGKVTPCSVSVEWWWEDGNHNNPTMKSSEEILFNSGNVSAKSTIYKAPVGYILYNYYWVKFEWTDDDGQHEVETSKAFCTSK